MRSQRLLVGELASAPLHLRERIDHQLVARAWRLGRLSMLVR
jgi:hypothetical protein